MSTLARFASAVVVLAVGMCLAGCAAQYKGVVKPVASMSILSPELQNLTDPAIETYLKVDVRPTFPSVLAVAKVVPPPDWADKRTRATALEVLRGDEAAG